MAEHYVVILGTRAGRRYAARHPLNLPVAIATGRLERASNRALRDALTDLTVELARRTPIDP
jgi:hypothetical protein